MTPLDYLDHRPWPRPKSPWVLFQRWEKLLFAHWKLPAEQLAPHIPDGLTLDTYEGQAYIGVVPFKMKNIHPRFLPAVPWLSHFLELNVRTYVTDGKKPGVLFFSLDAANPVGVFLGRNWYRLPYFNARMSMTIKGDSVRYTSHRTHRNAPAGEFAGSYCPNSEVFQAQPSTLEYFLTERYCLYATGRKGELRRAEIHHAPWPLQIARAEIMQRAVTPFNLPNEAPLVHYADGIDVVIWGLKKVQFG